jgi:hypothetical protein
LHGVPGQNPDGSFACAPEANFSGTDSVTCEVNDGESA